MCIVLKELYQKVYKTDFNYQEFDNRLVMQKTVYLFESMGVHVGDYGFSWYKHGPFSFNLQEDMYLTFKKEKQTRTINLSKEALDKVEIMKKFICENKYDYTQAEWLETIASLHYLKYISQVGKENKSIINELVERKHHLNNISANKKAMEIADQVNKVA